MTAPSKPDFAYLVSGYTGEYADRHSWTVSVYASEEEATRVSEYLNSALKELRAHANDRRAGRYHDFSKEEDLMRRLDEDCAIDYTGAAYYVERVPIDLKLPEAATSEPANGGIGMGPKDRPKRRVMCKQCGEETGGGRFCSGSCQREWEGV